MLAKNFLCLNNINMVSNLVMSKRVTRQGTKLKVAHGVELIAEGQAYLSISLCRRKIWNIKKKSQSDQHLVKYSSDHY